MFFKAGLIVLIVMSLFAISWGCLELVNPASQIKIESSPVISNEGNSPALEGYRCCGLYAVLIGITSLILIFFSWFRQPMPLTWVIISLFTAVGWGGEMWVCLYYKDPSAVYLFYGMVFSCIGLGLTAPRFLRRKTVADALSEPVFSPK